MGPQVTIGDALRGRANSFGFIRLILAVAVIFDHAFPLGGFGHDPGGELSQGQETLGGLAVAGFFAVSGYLITLSGMSSNSMRFIWRRTLRIFPAYWAMLCVTALLVVPAIWIKAGNSVDSAFWNAPDGPLNYIFVNWRLDIETYGILDVFKSNTPYGVSVDGSVLNGSIWTLIYEWRCYLLIWAMVAAGILTRARAVVPAFAAFFVVLQFLAVIEPGSTARIAPFFADQQTIYLTLIFLMGGTIAVYRDKIPFSDGFGICSGAILIATLHYGGYRTIGIAAGVYFVIYLAARLPAAFQRVGVTNDYSYGIYIYGFLVQQVLVAYGFARWGYFPYVLSCLAVTAALAWFSWHLVEKRALMLKDLSPIRIRQDGMKLFCHIDDRRYLRTIRTTHENTPTPADPATIES